MSSEDVNLDELSRLLEELVRRGRQRSTERLFLPPPHEQSSVFFVSGERTPRLRRSVDEGDVEHRVANLEKAMTRFESRLEDIDAKLGAKESLKEDSLRQFKDMIMQISEVKEAYYMETPDGFDIWTLFKSSDRVKTLRKIVQVQVELDRMYKDIYFDFLVDRISDIDKSELKDWKQLYKAA